jgi:hypothetical protein
MARRWRLEFDAASDVAEAMLRSLRPVVTAPVVYIPAIGSAGSSNQHIVRPPYIYNQFFVHIYIYICRYLYIYVDIYVYICIYI